MKKLFAVVFLALLLIPSAAADNETVIYEMQDESGQTIMRLAGRIYVGDEYISSDNRLYTVTQVNDHLCIALARYRGMEPFDLPAMAYARETAAAEKPLICIYHTHSDESYIEGDGTESKMEDAGIYDIGESLAAALEERGFTVEHSDETFHPHDAKAYERSRRTAEEMVKKTPAAIFDVHRDGIPDESEYETKVQGENTSMVRLLVGRSNQNSSVNRAFAKELKAAADEKYPGLIKDIFIGKGNYNQELYPHSVLLEFGTHTIEKEKALSATEYMADVISDVLGENTAQAAPQRKESEETSGAARGAIWLVVARLLALAIYALVSSGSSSKMKRGMQEMTGGLFGGPKNNSKK